MSYSSRESSIQDAQPIRLYQFQRGPLKWGFTTADRDISHLGISFKSIEGGISDDGIRQTEKPANDTLRISSVATLDVAQMYRQIAPSQTVHVTIFDLQYGENDYLVSWVGIVVAVKFPTDFTCSIECKTLDATLEQTGLRATWTRVCPHQLYNTACGVERQNFKVESTVAALDAVSIQAPDALGYTDDWFSGGYVEWLSEYGIEQRGIESHQGTILQLYGGTYGLTQGQNISLFAGCDRTFETCKTKFNNSDNNGAAPHMPGKSPFDGSPIL
jgi:uncharacterized phage protein (TIGR02218 family)